MMIDQMSVAKAVEKDFGMRPVKIETIVNGLNKTFKLGLEDGRLKVVKVYHQDYGDPNVLAKRHALLQDLLSSDADVAVSRPLRNMEGFTWSTMTIGHAARTYSVFDYIDGVRPEFNNGDAFRLGKATATLHKALAGKEDHGLSPISFEKLISRAGLSVPAADYFSAAFKQKLASALEKLTSSLSIRAMGTVQAIHGDFNNLNCRFNLGTTAYFDFDDACVGPAMYDVASWMRDLLLGNYDERQVMDCIRLFLDGYGRLATIDSNSLEQLPGLIICSVLDNLLFLVDYELMPLDLWPSAEELFGALIDRFLCDDLLSIETHTKR